MKSIASLTVAFVLLTSGTVFAESVSECRPKFAIAIERATKNCAVWGCHGIIATTAEVIAQGINNPSEIIAEVKKREGKNYYSEGPLLLMAELGLIKF